MEAAKGIRDWEADNEIVHIRGGAFHLSVGSGGAGGGYTAPSVSWLVAWSDCC